MDLSVHTFFTTLSFYSLWYFRNTWFTIVTIPFFVSMVFRNFQIFHDCCHNSYTPNRYLNFIIGHITGAIVITSPNWHLDHHTHHLTNGNAENIQRYAFNETVNKTKKQFLEGGNQTLYRIYKNPVFFFIIMSAGYFAIIQRFFYIVKKYRRPHIFKESLFAITMNHIINNAFLYWIIYILCDYGIIREYMSSMLFTSAIGFTFFHNEHTFNPPYVVGNDEWSHRDNGLSGSSFIQIPWFLKYFTMGIEYHHIHHMNAKIPGYNLQAYHEEVVSKSNMFDRIIKLSMKDCYNNLWLVLYDEEKKRYITFAGLEKDKEE
jgi:omega-6 fatty acid desaturase (delta-12 desaturase)